MPECDVSQRVTRRYLRLAFINLAKAARSAEHHDNNAAGIIGRLAAKVIAEHDRIATEGRK